MRTQEQEDIIELSGSKPWNIVIGAVAGSGKTTTLLWMIEDNFSDVKTLVVSFTKKVANNMNGKLAKSKIHKAQAINMHRIGFRFLANADIKITVEENKVLSICLALVHRYHGNEDPKLFSKANDIARVVALARVKRVYDIKPSDVIEIADEYGYDDINDPERPSSIPPVSHIAFEALEMSNWFFDNEGIADFDDMIVQPLRLGLEVPEEFAGIKVAMIDEVQDLNRAQMDLFFSIVTSNTQIVAAGDPYQAMFSFAGADPESYEMFKERMELHNKTVEMPLTTSFRCAISHIDAVKQYVPHMIPHEGAEQGSITTIQQEHIQDYLDLDRSAMIIARWNRVLINAALSLIRHGLIVKVVGKSLHTRILSFSRNSIENWELGFEFGDNFMSAIEAFEAHRINVMRRQEKPEGRINEVVDIAACCKVMFLEFQNYTKNPSYSSEIMGRTYKMSYKDFDSYVKDMLTRDKYDIEAMTIHKAKGSEAEQVFILGADELPYTYETQSQKSLEEEKRIAYVAGTRSSEELYEVTVNDRSGRVILDIYDDEVDPYTAALSLLGMLDEEDEPELDNDVEAKSILEAIFDVQESDSGRKSSS